MAAESSEVLVAGGGPSGTTSARLLAMWGHRVRLVTRPSPGNEASLAESLTPSCGKFFDLLGVRPAIDAAGFIRTTGNTVWWGSGAPRVETFAGGASGWQVRSNVLERVLLQAAVQAGVEVERALLSTDQFLARPAAFRIDGTGRAGVLARARAHRQAEPGHRTVALAGVWAREGGWPLPDQTHTLIESYGDGWAWSVPLDARRRAVAVMVDPGATTLARGEGPWRTYRAEIDKTVHLRALLSEALAEGRPAGWDASMYSSAVYAGPDWLVAGDAGSFVDPLSSAGVRKALASGWLAAIAVHTALTRPHMAATALRFHAAREAEMYAGFLNLTKRFLREGAGREVNPFWTERSGPDEWDERREEHPERAAILAAWERLKQSPELRLVRGPGVRIEARPAIGGNEIVLERRVVSQPGDPGVRFLEDVDVVALVELGPRFRQVPDLYDAVVAHGGPTDLAAFLRVLATVTSRGWLAFD